MRTVTLTEAELARLLRQKAWAHGLNLRQRAIAELVAEEVVHDSRTANNGGSRERVE